MAQTTTKDWSPSNAGRGEEFSAVLTMTGVTSGSIAAPYLGYGKTSVEDQTTMAAISVKHDPATGIITFSGNTAGDVVLVITRKLQ